MGHARRRLREQRTPRHTWHSCDACGEVQLIAKHRACRMTYGCKGHMQPVSSTLAANRPVRRRPSTANSATDRLLDLGRDVLPPVEETS